MKLSESLAGIGQSFPYYPKLCPVVGGVKACIFLCAIFWKSYAEHDGWVQMSMETITGLTGLSEKEQRAARSTMKTLGILEEKENRLAHQMFYRINCEALDDHFSDSEVEAECQSGISPTAEWESPELPKGNFGRFQNSSPCKERPRQDPDKTGEETPPLPEAAKPKAKAKKPTELPMLPESLAEHPGMAEHWEMWQEHRRQKNLRLTPLAAQMQLKKLEAMGPERAVAALLHSIAGGWAGIFEPKPDFAPRPNGRPARVETAEDLAREKRIAEMCARNGHSV